MSENNNHTSPKPPDNFIDPYGHIPRKEKCRTTIDVAEYARAGVYNLCPKKGVLQTTINILLAKLLNEFKQHGITNYSPDSTYQFGVGNCRIILGGFNDTLADIQPIPGKPTRKRATKSKPVTP